MVERLERDYWAAERAVEAVDRFAIAERARLTLPTIRRALSDAKLIDLRMRATDQPQLTRCDPVLAVELDGQPLRAVVHGHHRRHAEPSAGCARRDAASACAPVSLLAGWPMNDAERPVVAGVRRPGRPRCARTGRGAQAASASRRQQDGLTHRRSPSSIRLIFSLPFSIAKPSRPSTRSTRVAAELLEPPAATGSSGPCARPAASASSSSERAISFGATPGFLGADLEQQLEQVADQRAFLGQARAGAARGRAARRGSSGLAEASALISRAADVVRPPARRQAAHLAEIVLGLGRMDGELAQRVVLDDPPARQILAARLGLAPARRAPSAGRAPPGCGSAA